MSVDAPTAPLVSSLEGAAGALEDPTALHKAAAAEVARLARPPRRTGRLIASGSTSTEPDAGIARWGVGYAVFVNFGTRYMRAQPFATGALARAESSIERMARDYCTDIVSGVRA